jgi:hypothetical protein
MRRSRALSAITGLGNNGYQSLGDRLAVTTHCDQPGPAKFVEQCLKRSSDLAIVDTVIDSAPRVVN